MVRSVILLMAGAVLMGATTQEVATQGRDQPATLVVYEVTEPCLAEGHSGEPPALSAPRLPFPPQGIRRSHGRRAFGEFQH
jgi:hypothetical protein